MIYTELPEQGVVFWPVGNGDSITVVVDPDSVIQIDLNDLEVATEDDPVVAAVVDRLAEKLPRDEDDSPRLAVFGVTHHDDDHCGGAKRLLTAVSIDELWVTARLWHERAAGWELCEDAAAVLEEAERRVAATAAAEARGEAPVDGDRVRILGDHPDADDYSFAALPAQYRCPPGSTITVGEAGGRRAEVFVHGPTAEDCAAGRNESSMLLQLRLYDEVGTEAALLVVGDANYAVLDRMFAAAAERGWADQLAWDVALVAHHCSRHAIYGPDADGDEERKQAILDGLEDGARGGARMVASSRPFPTSNSSGDDPPHLVAREDYEEIVEDPLLCTGEYPTREDPRPVVFVHEVGTGLRLLDPADATAASDDAKSLSLSRSGGGAPLLAALGATKSVGPGAHTSGAMSTGTAAVAHGSPADGGDAVHDAVRQARGRAARPPTSVGFG